MTRLTSTELLDRLALPPEARHTGRIAKKLLIEHAEPRPDERALLDESVEEIVWIGNLKPSTVARTAARPGPAGSAGAAVTEVQVMAVGLRADLADAPRRKLAWLVHRGIAHYPVLLLMTEPGGTARLSTKALGGTARDIALRESERLAQSPDDVASAFLASLGLDRQPFADLGELYQGWHDRLIALEVARELRVAFRSPSPAAGRQWEAALAAIADARREKARILRDLAKERQIARAAALQIERSRLDGLLFRALDLLHADPMPPSRR